MAKTWKPNPRVEHLAEKIEYLMTLDLHGGRRLLEAFIKQAEEALTIQKLRLGPEGIVGTLGPVIDPDYDEPCARRYCEGTKKNHPATDHPFFPKGKFPPIR